MTVLDWKQHKVGPLAACRICRKKALMRDEYGKPCHKRCAELEASKPITERRAR
jgi:hypothetical protein